MVNKAKYEVVDISRGSTKHVCVSHIPRESIGKGTTIRLYKYKGSAACDDCKRGIPTGGEGGNMG
jgi:flavoprotein